MSKSSMNLNEFKESLNPIMKALEEIKSEQMIFNTQCAELFSIISQLSIKIDLIEQETGRSKEFTNLNSKKVTSKKSTVKKTISNDNENKDDNKNDNTENDTCYENNTEDKNNLNDENESNDLDDNNDESLKNDKKKLNVKSKSTKSSKSESKTESKPVKRKSTEVKQQRSINKMEFFNKMYDQDVNYFNTYIDNKVKNSINEKNADAWKKLAPEHLYQAKKKAYYDYMRKEYDSKLQAMKNAYIADNNSVKINIIGKET